MGKSNSQVVGYRYFAKLALFIGNRIERFIGINFDNRGWISTDPDDPEPRQLLIDKSNLYGETEGGVAGMIDIQNGHPHQLPNLEYQKYFPLVSGYPYQSYLLFRGLGVVQPENSNIEPQAYMHDSFYLGNSGYMKEMLLWVKRIHVRNDGREQWYDLKAEVPESYLDSSSYIEASLGNPITYITEFGQPDLISSHYITKLDFGLREATPLILFELDYSSAVAIEMEFFQISGNMDSFSVTSNMEFIMTDLEIGIEGWIAKKIIFTLDPGLNKKLIANFRAHFPAVNSGSEIFIGAQPPIPLSGYFESEVIAGDINPIHKIREILTDDTAMNKPESDVNDENFKKAADRIWDECLGISWAIAEKSCIEAINELCYHIEAGIRVNRQTGLYEMVLFRDDWFESNEIHSIAENKIKHMSLEVQNGDELINELNVNYYDRANIKNASFNVYENGSILTIGHANAETVDFPYFMNQRNAEVVANWKLKQFSTPCWTGSFTTGWREARKWNRYDLIQLPWSRKWQGTILVRIMKINLGNATDNTVTIDFVEVVSYSDMLNTSIVIDEPTTKVPMSAQLNASAVFEAPYYLAVLKNGQTATDTELATNPESGFVVAVTAKPQSNSLNALLYTDDGIGVDQLGYIHFEQAARVDYCDFVVLDQSITQMTASFIVQDSDYVKQNGVTPFLGTKTGALILLNDELMSFVSFDSTTKALTVKRGVLDTVPKNHIAGALFIFNIVDVAFDSTAYALSETVKAQVLTTTPSDILPLNVANIKNVEMNARAIRPYPPANVKINGEHWPDEIETDLILTWVDRNRTQQTGGEILSWFDSSVTLDAGTTYQLILIEIDEDDIELRTQNLSLGTLNTYTFATSAMNANTRKIEIILKSLQKGYDCYQAFNHIVELSQFFSAPYDLTVEFKND